MKFFGFCLFLILATLMASVVVADEDVDPAVQACKENCFNFPNNPVCGTGVSTYWNECVMKCENAELVHTGPCELKDLMKNHGISN